MDLSPARWIWLPSERTLPNTFVLFRREFQFAARPASATGWISADSRYLLKVNGERVQFGPAPCDPRELEADPVEFGHLLRPGTNVIGVEVLYYGHGDGTWVMGKPGLIFRAEITDSDGTVRQIASDSSWLCAVNRARPPGGPKRWYLRALQEIFDARRYPEGWDAPGYEPGPEWMPAMELACPSDKPPVCSDYPDYLHGVSVQDADACSLRERTIPPMREEVIPAAALAHSGRVRWLRDPDDWFQFRIPESLEAVREPVVRDAGEEAHGLPAADGVEGVTATFVFEEQVVGWPMFTIEAPEGAVVEVMLQEGHDPEATAWLDTHFFRWARLVCREGENRFEAFDYDSFRWMQLHVRSAVRPVVLRDVAVRRCMLDFAHEPEVSIEESALQRLMDACLNTVRNGAQETLVDCMGRERQQYSGDIGHEAHAVRYAFGETRQPARYLRTWSRGQTHDGWFMDCWPAFDRTARVPQRLLGLTQWGPILDHGIGFTFDCWHHYLESGDLAAVREPYPRLLHFAHYLDSLRGKDGLLPVEGLGVPSVWIDHSGFRHQHHKQCAFNLYAAAMLSEALAPLAGAIDDMNTAAHAELLARELLEAATVVFWDRKRHIFIDNLRWLSHEEGPRMHDRTLATSVLFDQCPNGRTEAAVQALADRPVEMGYSYPPNQCWRHWALAKAGRIDVVLKEWREVWARLPSVVENCAMSEVWNPRPDSCDQYSHASVAPLLSLFMDVAGIRPLEPGFAKVAVRPQLGDLPSVGLTAWTVLGPIRFSAKRTEDAHEVVVSLPAGCEGELHVPPGSLTGLSEPSGRREAGGECYVLQPGSETLFHLAAGYGLGN